LTEVERRILSLSVITGVLLSSLLSLLSGFTGVC
jgi:hypothetical protein